MRNGTYSMNPITPDLALWVGEEPPAGSTIGQHFDVLVLAAVEIQDHTKYPGVSRIMKVPLDDNGSPPTKDEVYLAYLGGIDVAKHLLQHRMVLSTCYMGKNRSSLVAGLALRNLNWEADKVIKAIRKARGSDALCNTWFEEIIRTY